MITVTQALSPFVDLSMISDARLHYASARGTAVHRACSAYAQGLWVPALPSDYQLYFDSFKRWFDAWVKDIIWVERQLTDNTYRFSGHPDLYCYLISGEKLIVDHKTPVTESPTWKAQIAAYCHLAEAESGMVLRLRPDGTEALATRYFNRAADFAAFLAALTAYRYFKKGVYA